MKSLLSSTILTTLILVSCSRPTHPPKAPTIPQAPKLQVEPKLVAEELNPEHPKVIPEPKPPASSIPRHPIKVRRSSYKDIDFTVLSFDRRDYRIDVVDQKGGPGSRFDSAREASGNGRAAINGGFFGPGGEPVGLVITGGDKRGYFNSASYLGTAILDGNAVTLATRKTYQKSDELLQSGPRLVWKGESLTGLSSARARPRSFLIWDGAAHFGLAHADSASLKELSDALKKQPVPGFTINYAVNLDGGTSCDFWVSGTVSGGGFTKSSFFKKKARNYLVVRSRD